MVRRKGSGFFSDWLLDAAGALLIIGVIVGASVWGYTENQTVQSIQQVQQHDTGKVKASAKDSAISAKASEKALAIVNDIPQFIDALIAGQNNLNAHLAWIECAMVYGAPHCGVPPAIQAPSK